MNPSRREFHAAVALLAAAPLAALTAEDKKPEVDALAAAADALAAAAKARYERFLNAEQLAAVQQSVRAGVLRAEAMKKVSLTNADEPAFVFSADA